MQHLEVHSINPERRNLQKISDCLHNDGLIICPTGSGYSLACHASSAKAIKSLTKIHKRIDLTKVSLVFKDFTSLSTYADISNSNFKYMNPLVPGPYTFILPATHHTRKKLGLKRKELGIHFPYSTFIKALFECYDGPLLTKSLFSDSTDVNFLPENIPHEITNQTELLLDMGSLPVNPTTIINLTGPQPELIREGAGEVAY